MSSMASLICQLSTSMNTRFLKQSLVSWVILCRIGWQRKDGKNTWDHFSCVLRVLDSVSSRWGFVLNPHRSLFYINGSSKRIDNHSVFTLVAFVNLHLTATICLHNIKIWLDKYPFNDACWSLKRHLSGFNYLWNWKTVVGGHESTVHMLLRMLICRNREY